MNFPAEILANRHDEAGNLLAWDTGAVHALCREQGARNSLRTTERALESSSLIPASASLDALVDEHGREPRRRVLDSLEETARRKRLATLVLQIYRNGDGPRVLFCNDLRGGRRWVYLEREDTIQECAAALAALAGDRNVLVLPTGKATAWLRELADASDRPEISHHDNRRIYLGLAAYLECLPGTAVASLGGRRRDSQKPGNLDRLEADSIHIIREVAAQAHNPAMLFSVGKDSCVMLHLARKAFYPARPPFPLVHVDTRWKFRAMYEFRDRVAADSGMDLIIHTNPEAIEKNINPLDHGSELHTHVTKTEALKQVLDKYRFDIALGGARRDEEKSRAKERVFSIRSASHRWDPKRQRPELWNLYNAYKNKDESVRAFPLSDWTELDIWQYIYREHIPIVPLYFASWRPVVEREGELILVDDDRLTLFEGEKIEHRKVRFRTIGCYPLSGAIESDAGDLPSIILELAASRVSERQGRLIDLDANASMEKKKLEGYF